MKKFVFLFLLLGMIISCENMDEANDGNSFKYQTEQFADLRIIRYQVPGFEELDLKTKKLLYFLSQAALSGRDIIYDQNFKHNLFVRRTLEAVIENYKGDKNSDDFKNLMIYTKRVWFSSGIHHHYAKSKFKPNFSSDYFSKLVKEIPFESLPANEDESVDDFLARINPIMFDETLYAKSVNLAAGIDLIAESANNYYEGVTQAEVEAFYQKRMNKKDKEPISWGLNSKLIKENGVIKEKVYKVGGMYTEAIEQVVFWLTKAIDVAENDKQKLTLELLIKYYETGDLKIFDEYSIAWVNDTESSVDMINGFIEVYGDALGYRGAYESIIQVKDPIASKRIEAISKKAQWFEDNSTIMEEHKKANVKGIIANVINAVMEAGDAAPSTPIGVNLPNANWIRATHGSKSISLGNIVDAYGESSKSSGSLEEFAWNQEAIDLAKEWGKLAGNLHTDMHEVIGHASGVINDGIGTPKETLKNYSNTLEEARADLVALYFVMDERLVDMGILPNLKPGMAEYNGYIANGLMKQLKRLELGDNLEESHMRNRQLNAKWAYEMGKAENVIERKERDGKTYFVINDYMKLRDLFGQLLREIQRIKSEGDFEAGKNLVETYGVKVDTELHKEVLARYEKLNIAPYGGFIQPKLTAVEENGNIVDVKIEYPDDFTEQMLEYSKKYSFLPTYN
ncbi:MAG: dihydrofolate reductase [Calditrichaeota bacterium]|nr:MAG: dihydrofolate reductase [Calditrichota bacterium]MBL1203961.1 dihydrofolate reductase [Calditrichota bacterium]NOG43792.1 dihydrofolate reductase [Calditrichota bacterium]